MAGFFQKAWNKAQNLLSGSGQSVLGIDISSSSIKVVQLKAEGGKAKLETYGEIALGPYGGKEVGQAVELSIDETAEAMRDVLREAKVSTRECGVAIPMSSSLATFLEVPAVEQSKLEEMVPIEARRRIPVPISEVYLDWHVIPQREQELGQGEEPDDEKTQILLVAIHKESISRYQKIIEKSELNASFFEIEVFSTTRSTIGDTTEPTMIVDFGTSVTKIYIIQHGLVRSSHSVNRGGQDMTKTIAKSLGTNFGRAEELKRELGLTNAENSKEGEVVKRSADTMLEFIFSKSQQVLLDFEKKRDTAIEKVVLTGGGSLLSGLVDVAQGEFDTDVVRARPFDKVQYPAFLDDVLADAGPELGVSIGAALRQLRE